MHSGAAWRFDSKYRKCILGPRGGLIQNTEYCCKFQIDTEALWSSTVVSSTFG